MLYSLLRPILFSLSPESAHNLTMRLAHLSPSLGKVTGIPTDERTKVKVGSHYWSTPVGLAAGLDKNAEALEFLSHQGFGALECGTITLREQLGNEKPRLFRYKEELSLRNSMGFPNQGLAEILPRIRSSSIHSPLGVNIGKNKDSTPEESIEELFLLMESLQDYADYFVINVSSPNTPGLRALQEPSYLSELFSSLNTIRKKDLYLKIAPDLSETKALELARLAQQHKLTGIIATNTTMMPERGVGGVSGSLLREKSKAIWQSLLSQNFPLEIIGVGGFSHSRDLFDFWFHGGKVIQVYTAYVYQGPDLLRSFQKDILNFLKEQRLSSLETFLNLAPTEKQNILKDYVK